MWQRIRAVSKVCTRLERPRALALIADEHEGAHAVCVCAFLFRPGQVLSNRQNHRTDNVHDLLFSA